MNGNAGIPQAGPRLDRLPMTKSHFSMFYLIAAGSFFDGFDIYIAGSILAAMAAVGFSTVASNATFISMTFVGLYIGTVAAGYFGDKYGRKFALKYSLLIYSLATVGCAIAQSFDQIVVLRAITGVGLGGVIITGYTLWVEMSPQKTRGFWFSALSFLVNLSQPLAALVALIAIPAYGWRSMFWIAGVPPIIIWVLQLKYMPESPRWLESQKRYQEAENVLTKFEAGVKDLSPIEVKAAVEQVKSDKPSEKISLWAPGIRRVTLLSFVISFLYLTAWFTFTAWIPTFFIKEGFTQLRTFAVSFAIMLGAIPGNMLAAWLSDKIGRKITIIGVSLVLGIISLLYGYSNSLVGIVIFGFLYIAGGNVLIAVIMGYIPELFPTSIRMMGASLANSCGRAGVIVSPFFIAYLYNSGGKAAVFISSFLMYIVIALSVYWFGSETTQKSLETIEQEVSE